jgi:(p)ppGpp synthase/HD superfamily hydrolase
MSARICSWVTREHYEALLLAGFIQKGQEETSEDWPIVLKESTDKEIREFLKSYEKAKSTNKKIEVTEAELSALEFLGLKFYRQEIREWTVDDTYQLIGYTYIPTIQAPHTEFKVVRTLLEALRGVKR